MNKLERKRPGGASGLVRSPERINTGSHPAGGAVQATSPVPVIPEPYEATGTGPLDQGERSVLRACEAARDNLRTAFIGAGRALAVIQKARLYRETHATFDDYVADAWSMSRAQAYRLIEASRLGQRLSPIGDKLSESHVRELLPVAARPGGEEAAVAIYEKVTEKVGGRVTAALLREAVRAHLGATDPAAEGEGRSHFAVLAENVGKLSRELKAATRDPALARKAIADLRQALDQIEREVL